MNKAIGSSELAYRLDFLDEITAVRFHPDRRHFLTCSADKSTKMVDLQKKVIVKMEEEYYPGISLTKHSGFLFELANSQRQSVQWKFLMMDTRCA